jgi:putative flippase GtrA
MLLKPTDSGFWQFVRFGIVGVAATVVDYAVLLTLNKLLHQSEFASVAAGYTAGLIVCYIFSIVWVFSHRSVANRRTEFLLFMLIGVIGLGLTELCTIPCHKLLNMLPGLVAASTDTIRLSLAKLVAIIVVFFFNFWSRKALLFSDRST